MIPHISDKGRRTLRTVLQVLAAFGTFAAAYPLLVHALGIPVGTRAGEWLATAGVWIAAAAAIITRIMAIPAVDQILTLLGVGSIPRSAVQVSMKDLEAAALQVGTILEQEVPVTAPAIEEAEQVAHAVEAAVEQPTDGVSTIESLLHVTPAAPAAPPAPAAAPQA